MRCKQEGTKLSKDELPKVTLLATHIWPGSRAWWLRAAARGKRTQRPKTPTRTMDGGMLLPGLRISNVVIVKRYFLTF